MPGNSYAVQMRLEVVPASTISGQRNHDLRLGLQPGYVQTTRTVLNTVLVACASGPDLREECERRRAKRDTRRAMKRNAGVGVRGIITFGRDAQGLFQRLDTQVQHQAYREVAEAAARRLGTTLAGLVVHADETAPHAHFQLVGYALDGTPVSAIAKRGPLRELQTIAANIMGRYAPGIERGFSREKRLAEGGSYADLVHRTVQELHVELPLKRDAARAELAAKEAAIARLAARIAEMEAEVAALEAGLQGAKAKAATNERRAAKALAKAGVDEAKADQALKNAVIYERRAEAARQEAERQAGEARRDRDAARQEARTAKVAAAAAQARTAAAEAREEAVRGREAIVGEREAAAALAAQDGRA